MCNFIVSCGLCDKLWNSKKDYFLISLSGLFFKSSGIIFISYFKNRKLCIFVSSHSETGHGLNGNKLANFEGWCAQPCIKSLKVRITTASCKGQVHICSVFQSIVVFGGVAGYSGINYWSGADWTSLRRVQQLCIRHCYFGIISPFGVLLAACFSKQINSKDPWEDY